MHEMKQQSLAMVGSLAGDWFTLITFYPMSCVVCVCVCVGEGEGQCWSHYGLHGPGMTERHHHTGTGSDHH